RCYRDWSSDVCSSDLEKFNASYPTKGRITEAMGVVKAMGGTMIRAHTLGVSTGNPLSIMPLPGVVNQKAFEPIDWAVYQAREKRSEERRVGKEGKCRW